MASRANRWTNLFRLAAAGGNFAGGVLFCCAGDRMPSIPMALFLSGACGAVALALGSQFIVPLDGTLRGVCTLVGVISTVAFVGLLDGR